MLHRAPWLAVAPLALALAATPGRSEPCESQTGRSVSVRGAATLRVKPDAVTFQVGVQTQDASVKRAFDGNQRKVEAMLAALKSAGAEAGEIQTSSFDVSTAYSEEGRPIGFTVSNLVTVRRPDPASAAALLQAALEAGANQVGSLQFLESDPAASERRGLELAFQNARAKAEALASFAGKGLGEVVCVTEGGGPVQPHMMRMELARDAAPSLEPGLLEVRFELTAAFELR
jgi:uncharacterized protein YggE